jgi:hypothetical protein
LRNYCQYRRDPEHNQIIRQPAFFVSLGKNQGDCKTFASFARSVYAAIYPDLETAFRYAGYRSVKQNPSHVYTVVKDRAGNEIIIDGCYNHFNREKKYTLALPLNFKRMKVSSLSGLSDVFEARTATDYAHALNDSIDGTQRDKIKRLLKCRRDMRRCLTQYDAGLMNKQRLSENIALIKAEQSALNGIDGINKKLTPEEKAKRKAARKAKVKKANAKVKKGFKKIGWGIAFVNLLPIRAAFTAIVAMNFNSMAHNLRFVYNERNGKTKAEWKKIEKVWYGVGGLKKALLKAIELGAKHKPLFLSKKAKKKFEERKKNTKGYAGCLSVYDDMGINAAPLVAAALAAAAGIIAAMIPAIMGGLKKAGKDKDAQQVQEQGQEMVAQYKQDPAAVGREAAQGADEFVEDAGAPEGEAAEPVEGIYGGMEDLFASLSKVAEVGIKAAGTAIEKKAQKKPKLQKFLNTAGQAGDDYLTGTYLRRAGYTKTAKEIAGNSTKYILYAGGAVVAALLGYIVIKKK